LLCPLILPNRFATQGSRIDDKPSAVKKSCLIQESFSINESYCRHAIESPQGSSYTFYSWERRSFSGPPSVPPSKKVSSTDILGTLVPYASAELHCTGEVIYVNNIPEPHSMLHSAFVILDCCHCRVTAVDKTKAVTIPGVVRVFLHHDLLPIGGGVTNLDLW
jgi:hypothetical protein